VCWGAVACTKDSRGGVDVTDSNRDASVQPDGGEDASQTKPDAQVKDSGNGGGGGGPADAQTDGQVVAGSGDGEEDGGGPKPIDPTQVCAVAAEFSEFSQGVVFNDEGGFVLTPGTTGFGVVFRTDVNDGLSTLPVAATGTYREPNALFGTGGIKIQDLSLLHVSGGFRMTWVDNSADSRELQTILLSDALQSPSDMQPTRVTNNQRREERPIQADIGTHSYLAWLSLDPAGANPEIAILQNGETSEPRTLLAADLGFSPTRFAISQVGKENGALVFVSETKKPGIWLLPLDNGGLPVSAPVLLSNAVSTGNSIDIAARPADGGAIVYSTDVSGDNDVRFRRVDANGKVISDEIKLISNPWHARDAGVARIGDSYVVAFRTLPAEGEMRGEIRLIFVTKEGNVQRDSAGRLITVLITDASPTGGRVSVRVSNDGQLLLGFVDDTASGSKLRLIRKRLDCAL
jgi:hypothetical protein